MSIQKKWLICSWKFSGLHKNLTCRKLLEILLRSVGFYSGIVLNFHWCLKLCKVGLCGHLGIPLDKKCSTLNWFLIVLRLIIIYVSRVNCQLRLPWEYDISLLGCSLDLINCYRILLPVVSPCILPKDKIHIFITSNDRSFGCPIIYKDTIHSATLLIDISKMLDTTKPIL